LPIQTEKKKKIVDEKPEVEKVVEPEAGSIPLNI